MKPRPNYRNISTEHIATLLGATCCDRLATLLRHVARCCAMLGVVASNLKMVKFFMQHCGCCIILWSIGQVCATMLHPGMHNSSIFNTQHVVTRCNRVAKRTQHVTPNNVAICCIAICWPESANAGPTMMGCVVLKCCYRLAGT